MVWLPSPRMMNFGLVEAPKLTKDNLNIAAEELYPLRSEDRHLAHSSKWHQVVVEARRKARILTNDMDQSRRDTINEWSTAEDTLGPIPYLHNAEILKELADDSPARTILREPASEMYSSSAISAL